MDRDAPVPASPADALPPHDPAFVRLVGLVGIGLAAVAAVLRLVADSAFDKPPAALTGAQLALVFIGAVTAGAAVSMRPDLWWAWGLGAAAAALGSVGLPAEWDSFPPLFRTLAGVGVVGAVFCRLPTGWRIALASVAILFHFGGIMTAATAPAPQPWIGDQLWTRVYNPYLQFIYMRNAYQFYSPNPGPASILAFLLKTETTDANGRTRYDTRWVVLPRRPEHVRDPLGLSYYRRLSLTEQVAQPAPGSIDQFEKTDMWMRRYNRSTLRPGGSPPIPFHPVDNVNFQYRLPRSDISRYVLPSYASHVIIDHTPDQATAGKTTVKVYRLEHLTLPAERFIEGDSPYHPGTYRPYFLGEFNARGDLVNPQEEMLYWLVPVIPRFPGPGDANKKPYFDYLSVHALDMKIEDVLAADENDGRVFNWSQLR
jgi:hypothetical protein